MVQPGHWENTGGDAGNLRFVLEPGYYVPLDVWNNNIPPPVPLYERQGVMVTAAQAAEFDALWMGPQQAWGGTTGGGN
jgi:hypothetical protein